MKTGGRLTLSLLVLWQNKAEVARPVARRAELSATISPISDDWSDLIFDDEVSFFRVGSS